MKIKKKVNFTSIAKIFEIICVLIAILALIYRPIDKITNIREMSITVTDKAVKNDCKQNGKYLIYGKDNNGEIQVLEITDSVLKLRFDSSNIYANIERGENYIFTVGGTRCEVLSWYPNIYEIKECEER